MPYSLSDNLRNLRKKLGCTQQNIADTFSIERSTYSYYENGSTTPSIEMIVKLSRLFGVTVEELLGIDTQAGGDGNVLNEEPAFSFKKSTKGKSSVNYSKTIKKILDLNEDELSLINQEIDKLIDKREDTE